MSISRQVANVLSAMNRAWGEIVSAGFSCGLLVGVASLACAAGTADESAAGAAPLATSPSAASAAPASKDAYVRAQLAKLFTGAPVHVVLKRAFNNWLLVDVFAADSKAGQADRPVLMFSVQLFAFDNQAAAREKVQEELHYFVSPAALTEEGYDEFYAGNGGRVIGRCGAVVVATILSPPEGRDAVFAAIARNLSSNPALLPALIHYAYTMHFGDIGPLHAVLAKLTAKVPELAVASLLDSGPYGQNSVTADYTNTSGSKLVIIAKSYDSEPAAKAGQEFDQRQIQAGGWDEKQVVQGVTVFENTPYGEAHFQIGHYSFKLITMRERAGALRPLLARVRSALIALLPPPANAESSSASGGPAADAHSDLEAIHRADWTDWRKVLESPAAGHDPYYIGFVERLKHSQVPTELEAKIRVWRVTRDADARTTCRVSALIRLARPDKDLGQEGDFVWEVRIVHAATNEDVAGLIWVSTTTGKAKVLYP